MRAVLYVDDNIYAYHKGYGWKMTKEQTDISKPDGHFDNTLDCIGHLSKDNCYEVENNYRKKKFPKVQLNPEVKKELLNSINGID